MNNKNRKLDEIRKRNTHRAISLDGLHPNDVISFCGSSHLTVYYLYSRGYRLKSVIWERLNTDENPKR